MPNKLHPHFEILPPSQQRLWPRLQPVRRAGFTLYGGTAVALQLGHRTSVDFDFFSDRALDRTALLATFTDAGQVTLARDEPQTLLLLIQDPDSSLQPVKLSFFGQISFGRVGNPRLTEDNVLNVASLDDLMATKLKTLFDRAEAKDYRDIAAMISSGVDLSRGLAAAEKMFAPAFQPHQALKALTYFKDGDLNTLDTSEKNLLIATVQDVRDLPDVPILSRHLSTSNDSIKAALSASSKPQVPSRGF